MVYNRNPEEQRKRALRKKAKENNKLTYETHIPCIRGHISPRYTTNALCVACVADPIRLEKNKLKARNITKEQYEYMFIHQLGLCAICNNTLGKGNDVAIDHCHKTGTIRGLLCKHCNMGLGLFRDNIQSLFNASQYLIRFTKDD